MAAPAYDYAPLPDPGDLAEAVERAEEALAALAHLEDAALARVHRAALAEDDGQRIPWGQVKAELGL